MRRSAAGGDGYQVCPEIQRAAHVRPIGPQVVGDGDDEGEGAAVREGEDDVEREGEGDAMGEGDDWTGDDTEG